MLRQGIQFAQECGERGDGRAFCTEFGSKSALADRLRRDVEPCCGVGLTHAGAHEVIELPAISETLSPLLYVVPAQMIGYHLGMAKFAVAEAGQGA